MAREANEDLTRLPKWAQKKIADLTLDNQSLNRQVKERDNLLNHTHPDTNVFLGNGIEEDFSLPRDAQVTFRFGKRWDESFSVRLDREYPGQLYIASLHGMIAVYPRSGNAVSIASVDR